MAPRVVAVPLIALFAAGSLAACSSSSTPSNTSSNTTSTASTPAATTSAAGGGSNAAFCMDARQVPAKVSALAAAISNPASVGQLLQADAQVLNALKANAPTDVAAAINDLANLLTQAEAALSNPSAASASSLSALAVHAEPDLTKLATWVASNCAGA
jgi:hypothetical protein